MDAGPPGVLRTIRRGKVGIRTKHDVERTGLLILIGKFDLGYLGVLGECGSSCVSVVALYPTVHIQLFHELLY